MYNCRLLLLRVLFEEEEKGCCDLMRLCEKEVFSYCPREYTLVNYIHCRLCLLVMVLPVDWLVEDPWDFIDVTFFCNKVKEFHGL